MSTREAYSYTVLRYVHDVMTGEFVNVGVVLHATGELKSKFRTTHGRVANIFPGLDEKAFKDALRAVSNAVADLAKKESTAGLFQTKPDALKLARKVMVSDDSSFQWSPPGSGVTRDLEATVLQLYDRFVMRHDKRSADARRVDADVWKPVREKLEELNVLDKFGTQTFHGSLDDITFKHAWKNGIWHAIEPVSLDLSDEDAIKGKAHKLRGHLDSVAQGLLEQFSLNVVIGKPSNPDLFGAYQAAKKILENSDVVPHVYEEDAVDELAEKLADEIKAHDTQEATSIRLA
jgi:hypothetical protein